MTCWTSGSPCTLTRISQSTSQFCQSVAPACSPNYEQAGRSRSHSTRGWAVPRGSLSSQGAPAPGGWVGHDSCRAVPGNDVLSRRTWGICEIRILTETAKTSRKSLPTELAKIPISPVSHLLQIRSLQTWNRPGQSQSDRPANWPKEPFLFLSQQRQRSCRLCQLLLPQQTEYQKLPGAIVSPHVPSQRFSSRAR